ncbi:hypothetical protein TW65_71814 [Stemphylium lycopersici]|nr:hypothetical protein TW65_71814 [Stemphylium lycopersici]
MSSPDVSAGRPVKEQQAKMINGFQNISPGEVVNIEAIEQCRCDNLQTDRDGNANKKGLVMTEKGSMYWENRDAIAVDKYLGDEGPAITYLLTYSFGGWSMHGRPFEAAMQHVLLLSHSQMREKRARIEAGTSEQHVNLHPVVPLKLTAVVDPDDTFQPGEPSLIALSHPVHVALDSRLRAAYITHGRLASVLDEDRDNFDITPSYYMRRAGMQRRKQQWDEDEDAAAQETETAKTGQKSKTHPTQKLNAAQKKGEDEDEDADYEGSE